MKISVKTATNTCTKDELQWGLSDKEGADMYNEADKYNPTYKEMAALIGVAATLKVWKRYAGTIVTFPTADLKNKEE